MRVTSAESVALLRVEILEHVAAPTGLDGIDDLIEPVAQNPLRVHADREHVRDRHRGPDDVGDEAVPDARGVLGAPDRPVAPATPPVGVAVGPVLAVHLGGDDPRVLGGCGVGPVGGNGRVDRRPRLPRDPTTVRLEEIATAREREADPVLRTGRPLREVFAVRHRRDVLEEPTLIGVGRREVHRKACVGIAESAMDVAMGNRNVPPFVDIDVRFCEERVAALGSVRSGHAGTVPAEASSLRRRPCPATAPSSRLGAAATRSPRRRARPAPTGTVPSSGPA